MSYIVNLNTAKVQAISDVCFFILSFSFGFFIDRSCVEEFRKHPRH